MPLNFRWAIQARQPGSKKIGKSQTDFYLDSDLAGIIQRIIFILLKDSFILIYPKTNIEFQIIKRSLKLIQILTPFDLQIPT